VISPECVPAVSMRISGARNGFRRAVQGPLVILKWWQDETSNALPIIAA
jgi:hypothetical protein